MFAWLQYIWAMPMACVAEIGACCKSDAVCWRPPLAGLCQKFWLHSNVVAMTLRTTVMLQVQSLQTQLAALDVQRCELVKELQHAHTVLKLPGSIPEAPLPAPNTTPQHAPHPLPHLGVPAAATACQLTATVAEFVLASDTGDAGAQQAARGDVELAAVPRPWLALAQALQGATSVPQPPDLTPAGGRT